MPVRTIEWRNGRVVMLDQRLLPTREVYRVYGDHREVARAIKDMVVRGAPAIGVAAAMGIALGARSLRDPSRDFERLCRLFARTRPTAVNLFWAIARMQRVFRRYQHRPLDTLRTVLEREALAIHDEDVAVNRSLGMHGAELLEDGATVLLMGKLWRGSFPLFRLPEQLAFYRGLRDRKRGKYAACYQPTVEALEALERQHPVPPTQGGGEPAVSPPFTASRPPRPVVHTAGHDEPQFSLGL